jgi:hypothetical protein
MSWTSWAILSDLFFKWTPTNQIIRGKLVSKLRKPLFLHSFSYIVKLGFLARNFLGLYRKTYYGRNLRFL